MKLSKQYLQVRGPGTSSRWPWTGSCRQVCAELAGYLVADKPMKPVKPLDCSVNRSDTMENQDRKMIGLGDAEKMRRNCALGGEGKKK